METSLKLSLNFGVMIQMFQSYSALLDMTEFLRLKKQIEKQKHGRR